MAAFGFQKWNNKSWAQLPTSRLDGLVFYMFFEAWIILVYINHNLLPTWATLVVFVVFMVIFA